MEKNNLINLTNLGRDLEKLTAKQLKTILKIQLENLFEIMNILYEKKCSPFFISRFKTKRTKRNNFEIGLTFHTLTSDFEIQTESKVLKKLDL